MKNTSEKPSSWQPQSIALVGGLSSNLFLCSPNEDGGIHVDSRICRDFEIAFLHKMANKMSAGAPMPEVLTEIAEFVLGSVKCDLCTIFVLESDDLTLRSASNPRLACDGQLKINLGSGTFVWEAQHRSPLIVPQGAANDPRTKGFCEIAGESFEATLSIPLANRSGVAGVINVHNRARHKYSEREISLLATIGFLLGAEIGRAQLERKNQALKNQLKAEEQLEAEMKSQHSQK